MSENVIEVVEVKDELTRHALGKLLLATLVGFAASKLAEKTYDFALTAYRQRTS